MRSGYRKYARCHDRPRLSILLCPHEWHQVDLAQCTVGDNGIVGLALVLLLVCTACASHSESVGGAFNPMTQDGAPKMFNRGTNSAFLEAIDICGSDNSGQVRVLGEELKALRDVVSLRNRESNGIAALYHRGGSKEMGVRNGGKCGRLFMIDARVECCRSGLRRRKRLSAWPLARAA